MYLQKWVFTYSIDGAKSYCIEITLWPIWEAVHIFVHHASLYLAMIFYIILDQWQDKSKKSWGRRWRYWRKEFRNWRPGALFITPCHNLPQLLRICLLGAPFSRWVLQFLSSSCPTQILCKIYVHNIIWSEIYNLCPGNILIRCHL